MFRNPEARCWPTEINENTATDIILNAIEEHIGGEALDSEMEPDNTGTVRAMEDLEMLSKVLWRRYTRTGTWFELAAALEDRIVAKHRYLANLEDAKNIKNAQTAKTREKNGKEVYAS